VNPIDVAPSLAAPAGRDGAQAFPQSNPWPSLVREAGRVGVDLEPTAANHLARYRDLLIEWSGRMNLTAVREPADIERKLFLDALAMVPQLDSVAAGLAPRSSLPLSLIDLGSGAGFPGLVLKIVRPALDVTLVDATAKKVGFLDTVIADLALEGVRAVHGRAEELGQDRAFRERFDLATARAVAALPVLLEYVVPFLRVGGVALLPKGLDIAEELRAGRRAAKTLRAEIVSHDPSPIPTTRLVLVRKNGPTPAAYPRRVGVPSHAPLAGGG
jgi:16S rRNA (guanine527-N7)-methyltransferase